MFITTQVAIRSPRHTMRALIYGSSLIAAYIKVIVPSDNWVALEIDTIKHLLSKCAQYILVDHTTIQH